MKVALITTGGPDWFEYDVIEYQGREWIVSEWIEQREEGLRRPRRLISLSGLQVQAAKALGPDYLVNEPIPEALFYPETPTAIPPRFEVVEEP